MKKRIVCLLLCLVTLFGLLPAVGGAPVATVQAATTSQNNIVARANYLYNST